MFSLKPRSHETRVVRTTTSITTLQPLAPDDLCQSDLFCADEHDEAMHLFIGGGVSQRGALQHVSTNKKGQRLKNSRTSPLGRPMSFLLPRAYNTVRRCQAPSLSKSNSFTPGCARPLRVIRKCMSCFDTDSVSESLSPRVNLWSPSRSVLSEFCSLSKRIPPQISLQEWTLLPEAELLGIATAAMAPEAVGSRA